MMAESHKSYEYNKIRACRTCLDSEGDHNILLNGENWFDLLDYCVGLNIKVSDEPQTICRKCTDIIRNFVDFKKKCLAADTLWRSIKNMNYLIQNYTTDVEKTMKKQLLDYYNRIDTPQKSCNQINCQVIEIKEEPNTNIYTEQTNLLEVDNINGFDVIDNDCYDYEDKLQASKDIDLIHKDNNKTKDNNNDIEKNALKCKKCNKSYGREGWLKMHKKLCGKTSDERKEIRKNNKKIQGHICGLCRFTSSSEDVVSEHFEGHCSRNDLKCQLCKFVGLDFADMVAHRLSHSSKAFKVKKSCPACKKTFTSRLSMQFHYRSTHLKKNGGHCSKCNIEFTVYKTFKLHVRTHGGKKYICDFCGLRFLARNQIIEHLKNHMDINNFICHECGKAFRRHKNLLSHMRTVHVKEEPLKCTHCNKMFKNLYTLNKHRQRKLGTKNSLKCEFCGKCFASPHLLRSHRFWHSEERPHCCEICGSRYKAKGQLKVHMQKHTGSKPFECSQCFKCFATGKQLRRHASVHTGVRPHKCLHCERTFYVKKQMLNHCALCHKKSDIVKDEMNVIKE